MRIFLYRVGHTSVARVPFPFSRSFLRRDFEEQFLMRTRGIIGSVVLLITATDDTKPLLEWQRSIKNTDDRAR